MRRLLRGIAGRMLRALQGRRWYRRLGRRLLGPVTIVETVEVRAAQDPTAPGSTVPQTAIYLEARRGKRVVGRGCLAQHPPGYPTEYEWWIFGVEAAHPALRGLGIGGAILRAAVQRFGPADDVCVAGMVNVRNTPSLGMLHKVGFAVQDNPSFVREWSERFRVEGEYALVVWSSAGEG